YLVGFSRTLTELQVFRVSSPSPSTQALAGATADPGKGEFWRFFRLVWARTYAGTGESLHRDLCLVSPSANHLIVARLRRAAPPASAEAAPAGHHPNTLSCIRPAEDVAILVINIHTGELVDTREYLADNIHLSGHAGVSLYEDQLCLLSLRNQCVRLLRIGRDGKLADMHEIGWYTREDDAIYEDQLRIREARALAAKHQTWGHASETPTLTSPQQGTGSASGAPYVEYAPGARWPAANAQPGVGLGEQRPPFLFPFSPQARQMLEQNDDVRATAAAVDQADAPTDGNAGLDSAMTPDTLDRAVLVSYRLLQSLPHRYHLMFRRIMHPATRLDSLTDSDVMSIEPSLTTAPYSGLKQKLLGALFTRARAADDNGQQLHYFFRSFRQYEGLVLWRAQFVTRTRLLLRFVALQVATSRSLRAQAISSSALANAFTLLAEYDIVAARFGRIWDAGEEALYAEVEQRLDVYRVPMAGRGPGCGSSSAQAPSMANDVYLRDAFESAQSAIRMARSGGPVQAMRKASAVLPLAPQCVQESSLLSPEIFQCNLRTRQALERFRPVGLAPIRFFDRPSGAVKFVLAPGPSNALSMATGDVLSADPAEPQGTRVLQSGAVLASTGGGEEADLFGEGASSSAAQATPTVSTPGHMQSSGHKMGVIYLFHPTLPLVVSTRGDRGTQAPLPTCNIHFRHGS
ncbi:hypothetical protein LPJ61_002844, partial [Coemansia biformis]